MQEKISESLTKIYIEFHVALEKFFPPFQTIEFDCKNMNKWNKNIVV